MGMSPAIGMEARRAETRTPRLGAEHDSQPEGMAIQRGRERQPSLIPGVTPEPHPPYVRHGMGSSAHGAPLVSVCPRPQDAVAASKAVARGGIDQRTGRGEAADTGRMALYYYGDFYRLGGTRCRSTLEIVVTDEGDCPPGLLARAPDVVVVMMNPGGSRPMAQGDGLARTPPEIGRGTQLVRAQPDDTQLAIARMMAALAYRHVRVLNLSDVREIDSRAVCRAVRAGTLPDGDSVFSHGRRAELDTRLNPRTRIVVVAWSCYSALRQRASDAETRIREGAFRLVGWPGSKPHAVSAPGAVQAAVAARDCRTHPGMNGRQPGQLGSP